MDELYNMYKHGETSETLRHRFKTIVLLNDIDEVRRIWARFPMSAWHYAMPDLMQELIARNALEMVAAFKANNHVFVTTRVPHMPPMPPMPPMQVGRFTIYKCQEESIIVEYEDYITASMLFKSTLAYLTNIPAHVDTSATLHTMVCHLLDHLDFKVAKRLAAKLSESHGWNIFSQQFKGHVDIKELTSDILAIKNAMFTPQPGGR